MSTTPQGNPPNPDDDPDNSTDGDDKKFSQQDLNEIGTKEHRKGKRAGLRAALEALGFEDLEEATSFVEKAKKKPKSKKPKPKPGRQDHDDVDDDDDRDREAERKAKDREDKAAMKELQADLRSALILAGAPTDRTKLAEIARMFDLKPGLDEDEISDEVDEFKKRWPDFFKSEKDADSDEDDDDRSDKTKDGAPDNAPASSGGKRKRPTKEDGFAKADRRFEERHPKPAT